MGEEDFDEFPPLRPPEEFWGRGPDDRRRKPCPENPLLLAGAAVGMYHCPSCGDMQVGGLPHLQPEEHYEKMFGMDWPPGYEDQPE